jgi:hypothetical protein
MCRGFSAKKCIAFKHWENEHAESFRSRKLDRLELAILLDTDRDCGWAILGATGLEAACCPGVTHESA